MIKEENVDVETTLTEEGAEARVGKASTVLGKFKDVDALARAYESLQAEFTRRSQRLRTLEKEAENFKRIEREDAGAEKLRKTAKTRREETKAFDEFVADIVTPLQREKPVELEKEPLETIAVGQEDFCLDGKGTPEEKEGEKLPSVVDGGQKDEESFTKKGGISSEELLKRALDDESVRLKIVGEYLSSLGKRGAPLTGKGTGVFATPPKKAQTVGEAGDMALLYFRKPTVG